MTVKRERKVTRQSGAKKGRRESEDIPRRDDGGSKEVEPDLQETNTTDSEEKEIPPAVRK